MAALRAALLCLLFAVAAAEVAQDLAETFSGAFDADDECSAAGCALNALQRSALRKTAVTAAEIERAITAAFSGKAEQEPQGDEEVPGSADLPDEPEGPESPEELVSMLAVTAETAPADSEVLVLAEQVPAQCPMCYPNMCHLPSKGVYKQCSAATPYYDASRDLCLSRCTAGPVVPAPAPYYPGAVPNPYVPAPAPYYPGAVPNPYVPAPAPYYPGAAARPPYAPSPGSVYPGAATTYQPPYAPAPSPFAPAGGVCTTATSGTCQIFGCSSSRGPTNCVKGACLCKTGYCANKNGVCVRASSLLEEASTSVAPQTADEAPQETVASLVEVDEAGPACPMCFPNMCHLPSKKQYKQCSAAMPYYDASKDLCLSQCTPAAAAAAAGVLPGPAAPAPAYPAAVPSPSPFAPQPAAAYTAASPYPPSAGFTPAPGGACVTATAGTCRVFGCGTAYGPVKCVQGQCMCEQGYCADKAGVCKMNPAVAPTPPAVCKTITSGACRIFECGTSYGPTQCERRQCVCKPGHCIGSNGICVKY